jgi:outer membrane protein OmpA-like peptidoglycan-associated protein
MRAPILCLLAATLAAPPALAQVTTNDQALDALKPAAPPASAQPAAPAAPETPAKPRPHRAPAHKPPGHTATGQKGTAARPGKSAAPPQVPLAPPANPVILPAPFVMPAHPRPKPPPVPVKADAEGTVTAIPGGSRVTFGAGVSTLNQATYDAILAVGALAKANPGLQIFVTAWAPGTPDDPSPPRMLALERALAARAVLINAGIASDRIFAVSKGFDGISAGPPDRLEITAAAPKQTPAGAPAPRK